MSSEKTGLEVAIIGLAGRFPGAKNIEEFWRNLQDGVESVKFFSDEELLAAGIEPALLSQSNYVKAGAILNDIEMFDAAFFGYTPREAEILNPQHRLFLECADEALENAAYNPQTYKSPIGVYAAVGKNDYLLDNIYPNSDLIEAVGVSPILIANGDYLSTLVSYKLDLSGASITVQTACSSSLVAVHLACQGLLSGDCEMALAGGVSIRLPQMSGYIYQEGGIVSVDGHCRTFDAKAKGAVGGNGLGIVVLKRLENAIKDGDRIYAVIKGSAINNDGAQKIGYTAPGVEGQANVILAAQATSEIAAETITYIEAHGTATPLGDPIELEALTQAFRTSTAKKGFCAIGSLKTNMGHLDAAAGVAGLIKTTLALQHKVIPASLNFEQPNSKIDFANSPFYVNTKLSKWDSVNTPRRSGVSSFGIGGTNAHLILEESPLLEQEDRGAEEQGRKYHLLIVSAKTDSALETMTVNLAEYLQQHPDINLADVVHTLQVGRRTYNHRRMLVCRNLESAIIGLKASEPSQYLTTFQEKTQRPVTFLFPGQGSQYVNMARELYEVEPTFQTEFDHCAQLLLINFGLDLHRLLYPEASVQETAQAQLQQTHLTQPALFVIEYALAKLWMSWGIKPQAMIGHSIGEYVAACLAGVFSLEDGLTLVITRAKLMQELPKGAMLAVPLPESEIKPLLNEQLSLAAINAPSQCVVSGLADAIATLQNQLTKKGVDCRLLHTSHAFHSTMMEPICAALTEQIAEIQLHSPQIPYISNVTGTWITPSVATDPNYWTKHLRQPVLFNQGVEELLQESDRVFLEVGPGRTLSTFIQQHSDKNTGITALASLRHPRDESSDVAFLQNTLGQLWLAGVEVDWSGLYIHERRQRLALPTYPFERQRYWLDAPNSAEIPSSPQLLPNKKLDISKWLYIPSWKRTVSPSRRHSSPGCTLVFSDDCGLGLGIVRQLELEGETVITLKVGSEFHQISERLYSLNPKNHQDYDTLLQELHRQGLQPQKIIHLWSVTENYTPELEIAEFDKAQETGFYSLLFLAQTLAKHHVIDELQITVVSNNVQQVTGVDIVCPAKATILGPVKVIPQEYPNITCRNIDIIIPKSSQDKLVEQIVAELTCDNLDKVIAYRGYHRLVQTFEPVQWDESVVGTPRLREKGVYLITGGLGKISLLLAEHLAKTVQGNLILIGRSPFPAKDSWEQWLVNHDHTDSISQKIQKLIEIESFGGKVLIINADVSNQQQMQAAIDLAKEKYGRVNGVIHAVAIADSFHAIEQTSYQECLQQFQPKIHGLLVLEKIFQNQKLDFCLLLSSLSSILGGLGFVAYSAANNFLDIFAHKYNPNNSIPWISINWDAWQFDSEPKITGNLAELALNPQEGIKIFQYIFSQPDVNQWVVSTGNLQARIDQWIQLKILGNRKDLKSASSITHHARPNLRNAYIAPSNEIEKCLVNIWQDLLGIEPIGIEDNFFELGGNSLTAIQIISRLREIYLIDLPVNDFFETPKIISLTETIFQAQIANADSEILAQALADLAKLSDEDVQKLLAAE
ncbi:type I polyketide synthase [Nostoc punctiforme]|uniref:Phenolphthiocerol/phthiocerol polyketide synthase subunit E n=1 Tax=Nostoc punctiforme (strain ATCC 29133 / PCC 73102) TaxID=63737 RepID=B2IXJ8_NOSP7|nr:type I polyketide synthase [Nostoc punctiforme]ACC81526.1 beta-ketoacyl synthase [Nostoc punctiforme PCC 73102]